MAIEAQEGSGKVTEGSALIEKDDAPSASELKKKRHLIDLPMYDEDTGKSCVPAWNNSPMIFVFISMLALIACICMVIAQILPFFFVKINILQGCLRVYMILFTLVFVLSEIEVRYVAENVTSLQNWVLRGVMYSFIGLIGAEESRSVVEYRSVNGKLRAGLNTKVISIFIEISSWAMVGAGLLYFLMGIFRLKRIKDKRRNKADNQQTS